MAFQGIDETFMKWVANSVNSNLWLALINTFEVKHEFASLEAEDSVKEELEALKQRVAGLEEKDKDVAEG